MTQPMKRHLQSEAGSHSQRQMISFLLETFHIILYKPIDSCTLQLIMEFTAKLRQFLKVEQNLSDDAREKINVLAKKFLIDLTDEVSEILFHGLYEGALDEEDVRTLVQCSPKSLHYEDSTGDLPIQRAAKSLQKINFIPILALEGAKHNVGGEGMRGGLLRKSKTDNNLNTLQYLVSSYENSGTDGEFSKNVLAKLRESNLLEKDDVRRYDLLWLSGTHAISSTFQFLVDWDPYAMKHRDNRGRTLLHRLAQDANFNFFLTKLETGLHHFPNWLGFLFERDNSGYTVLNLLRKQSQLYAPLCWSHYWKDIENCLKKQGTEILSINPVNNTYPFMIAACGDASDLDTLYCLLRWNPAVVDYPVERRKICNRKRKER